MSIAAIFVLAVSCLVAVQAHYYSSYGAPARYPYYCTSGYNYNYGKYNPYPRYPYYQGYTRPPPVNTTPTNNPYQPTTTTNPYQPATTPNPYQPSTVNNNVPTPSTTTPNLASPYEPDYFINSTRTNMLDSQYRGLRDLDAINGEIDYNTKLARDAIDHDVYQGDNMIASHSAEIDNAKRSGKDPVKLDECLARADADLDKKTTAMSQQAQNCIDTANDRAKDQVATARNNFEADSNGRISAVDNDAARLKTCAAAGNTACNNSQVDLINSNKTGLVDDRNRRIADARVAENQQENQLDLCRADWENKLKDIRTDSDRLVDQCIANTPNL